VHILSLLLYTEGFIEATVVSFKDNIVVVSTKAGKKVTVDAKAPRQTSPK
jgi:hypothetical protein